MTMADVDVLCDQQYRVGLTEIRDAALNMSPVSIGNRRTGSPHEYYRYPARFPPNIVSAAISAFSEPGDVVADYFVGGGTTLVEARMAGRIGVGSDLNPLATFVSRVKTRLYSREQLAEVHAWADAVGSRLAAADAHPWSNTQVRHVDDPRWSGLIDVVAGAVAAAEAVADRNSRDLVRCSILRAAQWALDMRGDLPSLTDLIDAISTLTNQNAMAAAVATSRYRAADRRSLAGGGRRSIILDAGLPEVADHQQVLGGPPPALVVTSPPYPGVYMNYHRWKLQGRLETSLPYDILGLPRPNGMSYYTMSARSDRTQDLYFGKLESAYHGIVKTIDSRSWVVQVVGFSDVDEQLPRYLKTMNDVGLREVTFPDAATAEDGRLWRPVPRRRWWARAGDRLGVADGTAREVVLFHQADTGRSATRPPAPVRRLTAA